MRVKTIMLPVEKLHCINVTDTIRDAIEIINKHELLSLPVVDGERFVGVLSKQYVFEEFFNQTECDKETFMNKKVEEFMRTVIESIPDSMRIEEAAARFITSKVRFIPITDKRDRLLGIVTQQAVFKQYQKMFGHEHNTLVLYVYDVRGMIAKICETVAKAGGDIKNMMIINTELMNLMEVFMRIDAKDFGKVVRSLEKQGFDVRDVKTVEQNKEN